MEAKHNGKPINWETTSDIGELRKSDAGERQRSDTGELRKEDSMISVSSEVSSSYQGDGEDPHDNKKRKKRFASAKKKLTKFTRRSTNKSSNPPLSKDNIEAGLLTNDELAHMSAKSPQNGTGGDQDVGTPNKKTNKKFLPKFNSQSAREESWKRKNVEPDQDIPAAPQPLRSSLPFPRGVHMPAPQPQMSLEAASPPKKSAEGLEMTHDWANTSHGSVNDSNVPTTPERRLPLRKTSSRPEQRRFHQTTETFSVVDRPIASLPRYKQWRGNNVFFCEGRIMLGVHYRQLYLTLCMIIFTWIAFFFLIGTHLEYSYLAGGSALMVLSIIFLMVTALRDPGVIPRHPPSQLVESMPLEMKEKMNYCPTCHIVRPPRTKHCRHCNNCITVFDHHCPWTGNCIGARNYRFFYCFLISITASSAFVLVMSANYLTRHLTNIDSKYFDAIFKDNWKTRGGQFMAPLLIMWTLLVTLLVGALLTFHILLLSRGQTTNEYLRGEKNRGGIPHGNIFTNCYYLWCGAMPKSRLLPMWQNPNDEDEKRNLEAAVQAMSTLQEAMEAKKESDFFHESDSASQSSEETSLSRMEKEASLQQDEAKNSPLEPQSLSDTKRSINSPSKRQQPDRSEAKKAPLAEEDGDPV